MDKSKLIAIVALVVGIALIGFFKEKPLAPDEDDHDHDKPAQTAKPSTDKSGKAVDYVGGVTKLQIKDERAGTGAKAKTGDNVTVNYRGSLLTGEVFDESYGRGPFSFQIGGQVIKGWNQGVVGMKVGGKRQLVIPSALGYGPEGHPPTIPGGATLKFDIELLEINGKAAG